MVCEEDRDSLLCAWEDDIVEQRKKDEAVSISLHTSSSINFL